MNEYIDEKTLTADQLDKEYAKLLKLGTGKINPNAFTGNKLLYHYQFENLMKVRRANLPSFYELIKGRYGKHKDLYDKHYQDTLKRGRTGTMTNRIYEAWRINKGSVNFFKAPITAQIVKRFNATSVLDFTAGWGGRLLGCWACGVDYVGIETNINLKPGYDALIADLRRYSKAIGYECPRLTMLWTSCLNVNVAKLDYDLILTSPPYVNLEVYEYGTIWKDNVDFYDNFLVPMLQRSWTSLKEGGTLCLNISPTMSIDLQVHLDGYKRRNKDTKDFVRFDDNIPLSQQTNGRITDQVYIAYK